MSSHTRFYRPKARETVLVERKKLAVLSNAHSGGSAAPDVPNGVLHVRTQNENEALEALRGFAAQGFETLVIHGGDGTVDTAIRLMREDQMFENEPVIAILKGGTTNMTWRDIGIDSLERVIEGRNVKTITRPIIKVESDDLEMPQYGFFFGTGAIPRAIKTTKAELHSRGITGPLGEFFMIAKSAVKLLFGHTKNDPLLKPSVIGIQNETYDHVFLIVATLHRLLLGLSPFRSGENLGVVVLKYPYRNFLKIWRQIFGQNKDAINQNGLYRFYNKKLVLDYSGAWTLDGELFEASEDVPLTLSADKPAQFLVKDDRS